MKRIKYIGVGLGVILLVTICVLHFFSWKMNKNYLSFVAEGIRDNRFIKKVAFYNEKEIQFLSTPNQDVVLVGVHGSPGSADNLKIYFESNKTRNQFQIVSFDRSGYGLNRKLPVLMRLEEEVKYLHAILGQIDADKVIFLGHSYGCSVVLKFLSLYNDRKYAAVLIGSPIDPALEKGNWWRRIVDAPPIGWCIPEALKGCNTEIIALKDELEALKKDLNEIQSPIIFFQGKEDALVPIENIHYFRAQDDVPYKHQYIEMDEGHFIIWTRLDEVVELLLNLKVQLEEN